MNTTHALGQCRDYISSLPEFESVPLDAIMEALELIVRYNVFKFDDTFWLQVSVAVMATLPLCDYAIIYFFPKEIQFPKICVSQRGSNSKICG